MNVYKIPYFEDCVKFTQNLLSQLRHKGEKYILEHGFDVSGCPVPEWGEGIVGDFNIAEKLTGCRLQYSKQEQGRSPYREALAVGVQMGFYSGYYHALNTYDYYISKSKNMSAEEDLNHWLVVQFNSLSAEEKQDVLWAASRSRFAK